jgi:hypothetical protein
MIFPSQDEVKHPIGIPGISRVIPVEARSLGGAQLYPQSAIMVDFPKGGDISTTRIWLDKEGFIGVFGGWKADAILGLDATDILTSVPGENGLKLWGFLNTTRQTTGKKNIICSSFIVLPLVVVVSFLLSCCVAFLCRFLPYFYFYCRRTSPKQKGGCTGIPAEKSG